MEIDSANRDMYREMTTVTVPRPIGWISTVDAEGRDNLAPFSHYNIRIRLSPCIGGEVATHLL